MELLLQQLLLKLEEQKAPNPFNAKTVIVQGKGMERWISQKIADQCGVCMNMQFPFPQKTFKNILQSFLQKNGFQDTVIPSNSEVAWVLFENLTDWIQKGDSYTIVRDYLQNDSDGLKRFQLSSRVANLFDQYSAFRPQMIFEWAQGKPGLIEKDLFWQFLLWRKVFNNKRAWMSPAQSFEIVQNQKFYHSDYPDLSAYKINIFGISFLPVLYQELLTYLGTGNSDDSLEICLYIPYPAGSPSFEGDISQKKMNYFRLRDCMQNSDPSTETDFLSIGNSLIMDLGCQADIFLNQLIDKSWNTEAIFCERNEPIHEKSLLHALQMQMELFVEPTEVEEIQLEKDPSILLNNCFSPAREVESVKEFITHQIGELEVDPADILVMVTDMEKYGSILRARFTDTDPLYIPHSIADQSVQNENEYAHLLLSLFSLKAGRFTAEEVLTLLESSSLIESQEISEEQIPWIRTIMRDSLFRWGRNAEHCKTFCENDLSIYSWESARDRIVYGCLMLQRDQEKLYEHSLPLMTEAETSEVALKIVCVMDQITELFDAMDQASSLNDWDTFLDSFIKNLLPAKNIDSDKLASIKQVGYEIQQMHKKDKSMHLSERVFNEYLKGALDEVHVGKGFLNGKVTICEMRPMRSIPAKVVCILGMNDGDFPRSESILSFDQISRKREPADRSQSKEDRNLFLEALLSAREKLYLSWTGRSIRDNSEQAPSVLIHDLQDHLNKTFRFRGKDTRTIVEQITLKHKLHAFDPDYFRESDSRLPPSKSNKDFETAMEWIQPQKSSENLENPPAPLEPLEKEIDIEDLVRFFANPALYFYKNRIHSCRVEPQEVVIESEMIFMNSLEAYLIKDLLLKDNSVQAELYQQKGKLQAGLEGPMNLELFQLEIDKFNQRLENEYNETSLKELQIHYLEPFSKIKLNAKVSIEGSQLFVSRMARFKEKDRLRIWLQHLLSTIAYPKEFNESVGIYQDHRVQLNSLSRDEAKQILKEILILYRKGLEKPLLFFPKASYQYIEKILNGKEEYDALESIKKSFLQDSWNVPPESSDYPYSEVFDLESVLNNPDFHKHADTIYRPLIQQIIQEDA
jgi:exodeoxyribonuclease V gamma subunit